VAELPSRLGHVAAHIQSLSSLHAGNELSRVVTNLYLTFETVSGNNPRRLPDAGLENESKGGFRC
jgi:hypothetical protein